jgi:hypothetical protein
MQHVAFSKLALNSLDRYGPCDYKSGERTLSSFVDRLVCLSIRLCMCVCVCIVSLFVYRVGVHTTCERFFISV